ncbi:DUF389 domain-containing protein [Candidatus Parcubacteria bacterium]|nr:MAG: DUF389 domain-containing protein [Candidatus Parcubacteria bacterium]GIW69083.1 MAG: hypothetical protein KatS3mg100_577 [Candidatus Parcubacteria bacterium]
MKHALFPNIEREDKARAVRVLLESTTQGVDYYLLLSLAVVIAAIGITEANTILLVASMLIAPLLYPILSLGLGIVLHDASVMGLSGRTLAWSTLSAALLAFVSSLFVSEPAESTREVIAAMFTPSLGYLVVAVVAGVAVTYALIRPRLSEHLPGVAVAVALLPPLAAVGTSAAWGWWDVVFSAMALFALNVGGIIAATVIVFSLFNMRAERPTAQAALANHEDGARSMTPQPEGDDTIAAASAGVAGGPAQTKDS